jgi:hypothetical protein
MFKLLIGILLLIAVAFAQYNTKTYEFAITGFSNDSLKITPAFPVGDYEGISVAVQSTAKDSSLFALVYQRGYNVGGGILYDRPGSLIDTFNTSVSGNFNAAATWVNSVGDSDVVAAIDSTQLSGYVTMLRVFTPYRSPLARLYIKGLTGNKKAAYNVFITVTLTRYIRVDTGTGRQPE